MVIPEMNQTDASMWQPTTSNVKPQNKNQFLPSDYQEKRETHRSNIEKYEAIIKLLDPVLDQPRILEYQQLINRDKQSITLLKPLPQRIESLQRVVDSQQQRVHRANQVIENWQLLRDAWAAKASSMSEELALLKLEQSKQLAEETQATSPSGPSGNEQQLLLLQSQSQQLWQALQGILSAAGGNGNPADFSQHLVNASNLMTTLAQNVPPPDTSSPMNIYPSPTCSPATMAFQAATATPTKTGAPSPPGSLGIVPADGDPPPVSLTSVPTPARAPQARRPRSHSPRRPPRASRSPNSPSVVEHMTMEDAQMQEDMLAAAENMTPSPLRRADLPVPATPMIPGINLVSPLAGMDLALPGGA